MNIFPKKSYLLNIQYFVNYLTLSIHSFVKIEIKRWCMISVAYIVCFNFFVTMVIV